jgi:hypothetical protein
MVWEWQPTSSTIHMYFQVLLDHKYKTEYQNICEHFLAPLYKFIFCTPAPCMTNKVIIIIQRIRNVYLMEHGTYNTVYGAMKASHFLPRFILDRLVIQEVEYHTVIHGVSEIIYRDKKWIWPPLPLYIST